MFNKMNQQKAVTNTQEVSKGREVFGNWELSDELDDADLMAVAGGVEAGVNFDVDTNVDFTIGPVLFAI